jgi:uncharacterized protein
MPTPEQARAWYEHADPIHDYTHVLRVYRMAERIAVEEGADLEIVRAAALLHDSAGTAPGGKARADHHIESALFAEKILKDEGWRDDLIAAVQHCIRAHRYRAKEEKPETIEAKVIFDADKLDVLGAIGAARTIAYAVLANNPIYTEPSEQFRATGIRTDGEAHSAYHEYLFKLRNVKDRLFTKTARQIAETRDAYMNEFFERLGDEFVGVK